MVARLGDAPAPGGQRRAHRRRSGASARPPAGRRRARRITPTARCWRCKARSPPPRWAASRPTPRRCASCRRPRWRLPGPTCASPAPATPARTGSRCRCPPIAAERLADAAAGPARSDTGRPGRARQPAAGGGAAACTATTSTRLTSPVEAGLTWTIGKQRRVAWDFPGAAAIRDQLDHGAPRQRVGLLLEGRSPARAGSVIVAADGTAAGTVTSGTFAPTREACIAMGYLRRDLAADGTEVFAMLRGKPVAGPRRPAALRPPSLSTLTGASDARNPLHHRP